jgi:hypothetical protein
MDHERKYPPEEVARHFVPVRHGDGWAVRVVATGELLGSQLSPHHVYETWEEAEQIAHDALRMWRATETGFLTGLQDDLD